MESISQVAPSVGGGRHQHTSEAAERAVESSDSPVDKGVNTKCQRRVQLVVHFHKYGTQAQDCEINEDIFIQYLKAMSSRTVHKRSLEF